MKRSIPKIYVNVDNFLQQYERRNAAYEIVPERHLCHVSLDTAPLYTKLSIPPVPSDHVSRPRLIEQLSEGISHKLIVVSAPPGSGKTTLLSQWARQSKHSIAWVSLDELDNDPVQFWSYIIWALQTRCAGVGERALQLLHSRESRSIETALTLLINSFTAISSDIVLIIDDYHFITAPLLHDTLSFFINHLPLHVHLIIASRFDPPLPLARLRARSELVELRTPGLHFQPHEIRTFFTQTMRLDLSEEMISALEAHTEGWIVGLQLVALFLQKEECHHDYHEVFMGSYYSILDYLIEDVLHQLDQQQQTFLLYTSVLEGLSGPLCDAVVGQDDSQEYLEQLRRSNLFLVPLDKQRFWYRYHRLFKEVLLKRLQNRQPDMLPKLYTRAYLWCEQNGLTSEAINYAINAEAFEQAAQLIVQVGERMIKSCEIMALQTWLDRLPNDFVRSHPQLCLLQVWVLLIREQLEMADMWLEEIESRLHRSSGESTTQHASELSFSDEEGTISQNTVGEVAALRAHVAALSGDIPSTLAHAQRAEVHLPADNSHLRSLNALNLGVAHWLQDNVIAAERAFTQACKLARMAESSYVTLIATCALAQIQMIQGQRRLAIKTSRQALKIASEGHGGLLPMASYAYIGMGQHYYEWNDLTTATRYLQQGIALSEQWKHEDVCVYGCTELAQVKLAQGDTKGVAELLLRVEQYMRSRQSQSWVVNIMIAQQARLALAQGDIERAKSWIHYVEYSYMSTFKQMLYARLCLAQGQYAEALAMVKQQIPLARSRGQKGLMIELCILEAVAYQHQSDLTRALRALNAALLLAEPEGYIRMFANEGAPMVALLSQALTAQRQRNDTLSRHVSQEYIMKLLVALGGAAEEAVHTSENCHSATHELSGETFSEREWEIIQLIATGMSNQEIAQHLIIAETTVKWHIRNIFSKLNVRSRSQITALVHRVQRHSWPASSVG